MAELNPVTQLTFEGTPDDFLGALLARVQAQSEATVARMIQQELVNFTLYGLRPAIFDILHPPEPRFIPQGENDL